MIAAAYMEESDRDLLPIRRSAMSPNRRDAMDGSWFLRGHRRDILPRDTPSSPDNIERVRQGKAHSFSLPFLSEEDIYGETQ